MDIKEGEIVTAPCRCTSVSLKVVMHEGSVTLKCPKCSDYTRVNVVRDVNGLWSIKSEPTTPSRK